VSDRPPVAPTEAIAEQYARRDAAVDAQRYSLFDAAALQAQQERLRAMRALWRRQGWAGLAGRSFTEVGCGSGGNLLDLLRLGHGVLVGARPRFSAAAGRGPVAMAAPRRRVLWYDFTYNNPRNPDVRGVPLARVRQLFPQSRVTARRVTLAPPLARARCRVHPGLYGLFNSAALAAHPHPVLDRKMT
jgi:hypothetical protein